MSFPAFRAHALRAASVSMCVLAMFAAQSACAADAPRKSAAAKPGGPLLSRDELRACMDTKARLQQQREEAVKLQPQLDAEKENILREGNDLKERLAALDRTNVELVEKYAASSVEHDKRIDAYETRNTAFNSKVDALTSETQAYKKSCENRRFDEKDERAIKQGK
jgi:hypothetical protein